MKVRIALTLDINADAWMAEYGTPKTEIRTDVRDHVTQSVLSHFEELGVLADSTEDSSEEPAADYGQCGEPNPDSTENLLCHRDAGHGGNHMDHDFNEWASEAPETATSTTAQSTSRCESVNEYSRCALDLGHRGSHVDVEASSSWMGCDETTFTSTWRCESLHTPDQGWWGPEEQIRCVLSAGHRGVHADRGCTWSDQMAD